MRAIVCDRYGPPEVVLRCEDVEKPTPRDDEVLIKVRAAAVNPLDSHLMKGKPYTMRLVFGLTRPNVTRPGRDVAGHVEAVGRSVTRFRPGDEVFGAGRGTFAEYACASEARLARKPPTVTFEQAASVPIAGVTALQGLRDKGHLRAGERVLINGAAGGVGTFAIQVARSMGAEVTGVCSARKVDLVRSLGAHRVIDYATEDFTEDARRHDVVLDCVCNRSLSAIRRVMTRDGRLVLVGAPPGRSFVGMFARLVKPLVVARFVTQKLTFFLARIGEADLTTLGELMANGTITPVIDRRERLAAVPAAIRDVAARHARGKIVITM